MSIDFKMSNSDYHNLDSLSASGAKTIAQKGLRDFRYKKNKHLAAFDLGTAAHSLTFERSKGEAVRGPATRRGNDWINQKEECDKAGKLLLTEADYDHALAMSDSVLNNKYAAEYINESSFVAEASVMVEDPTYNVPLRARPDGWLTDLDIIVDLKTTVDPSVEGFAKQVANFQYHLQAAFYERVLRAEGHELKSFVFIAVGKEYPHSVGIYTLDGDAMREGMAAAVYSIEKYAMAREADHWPSGHEDPQVLQIPRWAFKFTNNFDC